MAFEICVVETKPFADQQPGTSGLRKSVAVFRQPHYLENFIQSIFNSVLGSSDDKSKCELVVGGDGRFFGKEATQIITQMSVANGIGRLVIGRNGLMSTPAVSAMIRRRKAFGAIILTASHNPGGPDGDFGVKYNTANGGPAPSSYTEKMFAESKQIKSYSICRAVKVDLENVGSEQIFTTVTSKTTVLVVDPVEGYLEFMRELFDFDAMRALLASGQFNVLFDAMSGVTGPYVKRILCETLGAPSLSCVRCDPLPDFGGSHPDPNLTYGASLVDAMKSGKYELGAAFDGDGDRNMIIGRNGFFVTPSDSLAVLAANAQHIKWLRDRGGLKGVARSMPTGCSVDRVAKGLGLKCYEVPTGWKFFGNLMDAGLISLCGEESFGTGSDHIREKDGIWAALSWLSVLAARRPQRGIEELVEEVWQKYGRCYFTRWDYENCDSAAGDKVIADLDKLLADGKLVGKTFVADGESFVVAAADQFAYTDPVDGSKTARQGVRIMFTDGSRVVFRLSGTGSSGATVRLYIERPSDRWAVDTQLMVRPLAKIALDVSNLSAVLCREAPTVIT